MKQTDLKHLETLFEASETAGHALTAAMDAEVFAMMNRASARKLDKLAAATESAHNAYYDACAVYNAYYAAARQERT
jgi:Tfp pilus tip-associated adhesin PilY1